MSILKKLVNRGLDLKSRFAINQPKAFDVQANVLRKLIEKAQYTEFGKAHNFEELYFSSNIIEDFPKYVPLGNYSSMKPYWDKAYEGESDICWPGKTTHWALSSGTSEGASKYIPVTRDMLKSIKKTSLRQILSIAKSDLPKEFITKHSLMVAGSTELQFNGISYSGDLSGITTGDLPFWFELFSKPEKRIRKSRNWEEKIEEMVREAKKWDVGMIAGVPAWIQILFERIIKEYDLNTIHDIWPNFKVYIHGGVAFGPYKKAFENLLGEEVYYYETYLASEGFFAFRAKPDAEGMELQLKNGVYYEFIEFNEENFDEDGVPRETAEIKNILEVEPHVDYALLVSTVAGAWRYMIGDVIRFTNSQNFELIITGRTKHYLSLCGEHLSVDNMNRAVELLADELGESIPEFTVAGIEYEGMFAHQWYLALEGDYDEEVIAQKLDNYLKELNDDYGVERQHALKALLVKLLPFDSFINYMREKGKIGSQNKFPRVIKGSQIQDWQEYLERVGSVSAAGD